MKNTAIIFGGKSVEHDVSVITAMQCYKAVNSLLRPLLIYIDRDNVFRLLKQMPKLETFAKGVRGHALAWTRGGCRVRAKRYSLSSVINCCHGGIGENGVLAGILALHEISITSCDMTSAVVCMDKAICKACVSHIVDTVEGEVIRSGDSLPIMKYPLIVKPCSLGSSIGVAKCDNDAELKRAVDAALMLDDSVLVEICITPIREYNCAVYRDGDVIRVSEVEEPFTRSEILSFADKYLTAPTKGMKGLSRRLPADISAELYERIQTMSQRIYSHLALCGVVRIDYIYDGQNLYFNEVNTVPGSLSAYLYEPQGVLYQDIILSLIDDSIHRQRSRVKLITNFASNILTTKKT